jgi:rhodanese-related sulfurtransferase
MFILLTTGLMAQGNKKATDLDAEAFSTAMQKSPGIVLDVRTDEEVARGIIPGAIIIDFYQDDFKKQLKKLDKSKPIYVYCASGGRSGDAVDMLTQMGYTQVFNLAGGIKAWKAAGKPIVMP